jgi:hypothetical protein
MRLNGIDYLFWATSFFLQLTLITVLSLRHRARNFPFFTALIALTVATTISLYPLRNGHKHAYLVVYLAAGAVNLLLQLCVFYELSSDVFRPLGKWATDIRGSFAAIVGISIAIALGLTWLTTPPPNIWMRNLLIRGNFFSSVLMSELFVGMLVLSATVKLPWKTHAARIAQGLGFYSFVGILTEAGHSLIGMNHDALLSASLSYFRIASYLACLAFWNVMLWRNAPVPRPLPEEMQTQLLRLHQRVEQDLQKIRIWKK